MLNVKKYMNSKGGIALFSLILGLGLSCMFKMSCDSKNCLVYKAPDFSKKKVIKYNNKCYNPVEHIETCDPKKRIINV